MKKNKLFSLFFTLCLFFGMVIGTAATAYADNMTITLTIAPAAYNVTLTGGGNATTSGGATTQSVAPGQAMTTVTYTANSGYTFPAFSNSTTNGVTLTRASDTVVTVSGTPTANVSITVPNAAAIPTYTVSFAPNGGSGTMASASVAAGGTYNLPECGFTAPSGQRFKAWGYNGQEYAVGTVFTINGDATFTAVWEDIPVTMYTVSFAPNGGSGLMDPVTVTANSTYTLPACGFTPPAGKQFKAWMLGSTEFAPGDAIIVDCDATFTAIWKDQESGGGGIGYGGGDDWYGGYVPQRAYRVSFAPMQGGSAYFALNSGETGETMYVYPQTTVWVSPTPAPGYEVDRILWSFIDGTASYDITEAKNFVMPAIDVVVHVTFRPIG